MTSETAIANARLVLADEIVTGSVLIRDGLIAAIDTGPGVPPGALDAGGDYLAPGLIELHTDNLERHISPRPKVDWPHAAAICAHDAELASTGITTVFDAMRVGSIPSGKSDYNKYARSLASELLELRGQGVLRISHFLHLRAEICSETLIEELDDFGPEDRVGLLSLMDHTPGQRQFRDISKLRAYVMGKNALNDAEFEDHINGLKALHARHGAAHEAAAVAAARRFGAVLASHDDTTAEQVAVSVGHGVTLAEFPTTREAADACAAAGIATIMGGPNLVRGGSHSGNVAAADLARADRLDILSSDYVPASLLMGAMILADIWGDMARGIATVTANPARAVHLDDRGRLAAGLRADLLRFARAPGGTPVVRAVWARGARVG